jgi:hypothetical protein
MKNGIPEQHWISGVKSGQISLFAFNSWRVPAEHEVSGRIAAIC